jgi:NAD(P)-dependent dehydrogenase (short-subunit alcohol dehydrogenase family)
MTDTTPLAGRTALVTGGGRGIGRGISIALAEAGADVAVGYRRHRDQAEEVVGQIEQLGRRSVAVQATVEDRAEVEAMVAATVETLGAPSILVASAGIASRYQSVADLDPAHFEKVVKVHAFGPFHCAAAVLPAMRTCPRGDIVFVSSVATRDHGANGSPYNVGKAAMEELCYTLAKEEVGNGIHVNVVAPGLVVSDMGQRLMHAITGTDDMTEMDDVFPYGHVCRPEEVGALVAALCGPAGAYVTGQRIEVDGGGFPSGVLGPR